MKATVIYGPRDVRFEDRGTPKIEKPTDAVIRISATCVCGSDLWAYRGLQPVNEPTPMGHEYCGIVEEIGSAVKSVKPGQFVVHQEIGDAIQVYDTSRVMVRKRRSDLFRHWVLGMGAGDLIINVPNEGPEIVLPNVLFVARRVQQIADVMKLRPVVAD